MRFVVYFFLTCLPSVKCHHSRIPDLGTLGLETDAGERSSRVLTAGRSLFSLLALQAVSKGSTRLPARLFRRRAVWSPKEPRGITELSGALFGRFTSDSLKRDCRCDIRLLAGRGDQLYFWILEPFRCLGGFLRER